MTRPEVIVAATWRDTTGEVWDAARHHLCMASMLAHGRRPSRKKDAQGFRTSLGDVVTREEAVQIAVASGLVPSDWDRVLTSEDLW